MPILESLNGLEEGKSYVHTLDNHVQFLYNTYELSSTNSGSHTIVGGRTRDFTP